MDEGITCLYVDDEPDLLEITRLFPEQAGNFQVVTASPAQEALASLRIPTYDAIVSDYQMPDMDGIAFQGSTGQCEPGKGSRVTPKSQPCVPVPG